MLLGFFLFFFFYGQIFSSPFFFSSDNLLSLGVFVSLSLYFYSLDQCQPSSASTQKCLVEFMIGGNSAGNSNAKVSFICGNATILQIENSAEL